MAAAVEIKVMLWMLSLELAAGIDRPYWPERIDVLLAYCIGTVRA
ncbi:MAG TPA: hypothetical protein VGM88_18865 [Kofleriaceae bacterium]|jgi:hypothetical protein